MQGTVLYGPRDVRFEERPDPTIVEPTDALIRLPLSCVCGSDLWPYRGIDADRRADTDGPRVRRHRRGGRQRGASDRAGPVRRRLVLRLRQHLRDLPGRLPLVLHQPAARCPHRLTGRVRPHPARRRHPRGDAGDAAGGHDPQPAGGLRRARHRLVRRRGGRGRSGQDGGGRRRRRRRAARGARRQAARRRADHRDEPPRVPPAARPGVRRDRDRDRARRGGRGTDQGAHRAGSARTRSSRPSARRSR